MSDVDRLVTEAEQRREAWLTSGRYDPALTRLFREVIVALRGVGEERDRLRAALLAVLDGVQVCEGYPEDHDWYDEGRAVLAGPENPKGGE